MITDNIIGYGFGEGSGATIQSYSAVSGELLPEQFQCASEGDIDKALLLATEAFARYRNKSAIEKADFLEAIADEIEALGDELVKTAMEETALPEGRIIGERGRTMGQLRLFARLLKEGSWVEATIDTAQPDRQPIPKPDLRKMLQPVGPVVVFTASNFPLAFSTAGGDTASALAAGNPVIVKAHESHLGTNQLVSMAVQKAAQKCGMPEGVFSSLIGSGYELGKQLVLHPQTCSVAFTGSFRGGKALFDLAISREKPIPVFAEMGSTNPVVLLPEKLKNETDVVATQLAGSVTLGVGQFCTNPGLIVALASEELDTFIRLMDEKLSRSEPQRMLNKGIRSNYENLKTELATLQSVGVETAVKDTGDTVGPMIVSVDAADYLESPKLHEEVFGPFSMIVKCDSILQAGKVLSASDGQLTTTFIGNTNELEANHQLIEIARQNAGRVIVNGVPTGVEVGYAMQHGGPYPATTDSRFTSVGADAIKRFCRPICLQDMPQSLLPEELKDTNPLNIWRQVDGEFSKATI